MTSFNPNLAVSPVYEIPVICKNPICKEEHDFIYHSFKYTNPGNMKVHVEPNKRYFFDVSKKESDEQDRKGPPGGLKPSIDRVIVDYRTYPAIFLRNSLIVDFGLFIAAIQIFNNRLFTIINTELIVNSLARIVISYCPLEDAVIYVLNNSSDEFVIEDKREADEYMRIRSLPPRLDYYD